MSKKDRHLDALERRAAQLHVPEPVERPLDSSGGTFLDFMDAAELTGATWAAWRTFWKVIDALPLDPTELAVFRRHTRRQTPPARPVRECWLVCGRRSGKSRNMSARAAWTGIHRDWRQVLARGERATIPLLAADRKQATVALGYIKGIFELPAFAPFVVRTLREAVELRTGCVLEVHTCSFRSVRGFTCPLVLGDETAFWATDDGSTSPDAEVLNSLRPTMTTIPDALLVAGSTPYARAGALWKMTERHYGRDESEVVVWNADACTMNPTIDQALIDKGFADDAITALSEYGQDGHVAFRQDVEAFLSREAVEAVVVPGRRELPPVADVRYVAFVDPSGGSQDSFTVAIAHGADGKAVLDVVRERRPPFSPDAVVAEFAELLAAYRVTEVGGDRYGGEFPRELFRKHGLEYRPAERSKSDFYRELLPLVNAGRVELLEHPKLAAQLAGVERRVSRGGRDSIDHPPGGHDDVANGAAGALVQAAGEASAGGFAYIGGKIIDLVEGRVLSRWDDFEERFVAS